jgi:NAD(P)-dependent dehydrogenase (short-subunit alcohol dehydrogenase family)
VVTGVSRRAGIGYAIARRLSEAGAGVFVQGWTPHDAIQHWGAEPGGTERVARELGVAFAEADFAKADAPPPDGRHYSNAPIVEAILDIRVTLPGETSLDRLSRVNAETTDVFPTQREAIAVTGQFTVGAQVSSSTTQSRNGYVFVSADERSVFQAQVDGFAFSRLAATWIRCCA